MLTCILGALRNLAYRSNACRLQILDKDGADALLKVMVLIFLMFRLFLSLILVSTLFYFRVNRIVCSVTQIIVERDVVAYTK